MNNTIYINGDFLNSEVGGIKRFSVEILKQLDNYKLPIVVICNQHANTEELSFKNIRFKKIKTLPHMFKVFMALYVKAKRAKICLNLANQGSTLFPGSCIIHDVRVCEELGTQTNKSEKRLKKNMRRNVTRYKHIFCDSKFTLDRIKHFFPKIKSERLSVVYCGCDHLKNVIPAKCDLFGGKGYYLSVASLYPHKNLAYIINLAKKYPNKNFVIVGKQLDKVSGIENYKPLDNVHFTGKISDNELAYLYGNCLGFIFPSLYEGFGIPPLEAMTYGCKKIYLSNIPVLKEIYGDACFYFDPHDISTLDLDGNKVIDETKIIECLSKYTWENTTKKIIEGLEKCYCHEWK